MIALMNIFIKADYALKSCGLLHALIVMIRVYNIVNSKPMHENLGSKISFRSMELFLL